MIRLLVGLAIGVVVGIALVVALILALVTHAGVSLSRCPETRQPVMICVNSTPTVTVAPGSADAKTPPPACQTAIAVIAQAVARNTEPPPPTMSARDRAFSATKEKAAMDYYVQKYGGTPVPSGPCS